MRIWREEIFAPVATLIPFDDEAEALAIARDCRLAESTGAALLMVGRFFAPSSAAAPASSPRARSREFASARAARAGRAAETVARRHDAPRLVAGRAGAAAAPVLVRVRELTLQQATIGVGISANTGPRVTLEHRHRRPFGIDWVASNKFELGSSLKSWKGELISHPLEGLYRNLVSGTAERLRSVEEVRTSWNARVGRTQDTPRIERLYFAELTHSRVDNIVGRTSSDALSGNYQWVFRDVDSVLLPTQGYTLSLQGGLGRSHGNASSSGWFQRAYGRSKGSVRLLLAWAVACAAVAFWLGVR